MESQSPSNEYSTDTMIIMDDNEDNGSVTTGSLFPLKQMTSSKSSTRTLFGAASPRNMERIHRLDETIDNSRKQFQKEQESITFRFEGNSNSVQNKTSNQFMILDEHRENLHDLVHSPSPGLSSQITEGYHSCDVIMTPKSIQSDASYITYQSDSDRSNFQINGFLTHSGVSQLGVFQSYPVSHH